MNSKKLEKDYIEKLKAETKQGLGSKVEVNLVKDYKFRIVSRGDQLFYQSGDKAILIQMNPYDYAIYANSINKWDDDIQLTEIEREELYERVKAC